MPIKLLRWGNSVGARIPFAVLQAAGLGPGCYVSVRLLDCGEIRLLPMSHPQTVDAPRTPAEARKPFTEDQW